MEIKELEINGLFEIIPSIFSDDRGDFTKMFNKDLFSEVGIEFKLHEQYYSRSLKNVIRGMHFQLPPFQHSKIVYCLTGSVQDVMVDLRVGSKTYGKHCSVILDSKKSNGLFIPEGFAHGFCSLEDNSCMMYNVSTVYNSGADSGVAWNTCGIDWKTNNPIVSKRDSNFVSMTDFESPFGV